MKLTNSNGDLSLGSLLDAAQKVEDYTSMSLFQYAKRAVVNSRVFITRNLASEEILTPLMLNTMNLYTGLIMTALSMNRQISATRRVRDAMSVVATESFDIPDQPAIYTRDLMNSFFGSKFSDGIDKSQDAQSEAIIEEAVDANTNRTPHYEDTEELEKEVAERMVDESAEEAGINEDEDISTSTEMKKKDTSDPIHAPRTVNEVIDAVDKNVDKRLKEFEKRNKESNRGRSSVHPDVDGLRPDDPGDYFDDVTEPGPLGGVSKAQVADPEPRNVNLPSGRIIQINFGNIGGDKNHGFMINLLLQLSPRFIPEDVAAQFIKMNFTPSIKQRWMQVSAGEISFISDFIMGMDRRKQRRKAMKQDKDGLLREMIERQENSLSNSWLKLAFIQPDRQNIANTILIFDKTTFEKACSNAGLRFKNYNQRQKFFSKTFSMMIHVVDPMFNKVTTYYHGLDAVSEFTFDQIKRNSKTENVDLMQVMKSYAQGMAPKF